MTFACNLLIPPGCDPDAGLSNDANGGVTNPAVSFSFPDGQFGQLMQIGSQVDISSGTGTGGVFLFYLCFFSRS